MHDGDIYRIEQQFNIELPNLYRQFLIGYPKKLRETDAAVFEVLYDADRVIAVNEYMDATHLTGWPDTYFAVGETGCGDYFGIGLEEDDGEIFFWHHETEEIESSAGFATVEEFAGSFLQMYTAARPK